MRLLIFFITGLVISTTAWAQKIYWVDRNADEIARANLDGTNAETYFDVTTVGSNDPVGIAINTQDNYIYWTDYVGGDVYYGRMENSTLSSAGVVYCVSCTVGSPSGIDLDVGDFKMYFANNYEGGIDRVDLDGNNPVMSHVLGGDFAEFAVAVDTVNGKIYWTEPSNNEIHMANLSDGSGNTTLSGSSTAYYWGITVDPVNGKIYYVENDGGTGSIIQADLDGSSRNSIVTGLADSLRDIDIDIANGKVYWSEVGTTPNISRANTDGTNVEVIISLAAGAEPVFLALDVTVSDPPKIYWTENLGDGLGGDDDIHRVGFDGSDFEVFYSGFSAEISGMAIDTSNNYMYWTDAARAEIIRARIGDHGLITPLEVVVDYNPSGSNGLYDIALDTAQNQMYWTHARADTGAVNKISKAELKGFSVQEFIDLGPDDEPFGIDLDLINGKIYFTTNYVSTGIDARLWRTNLDGSNTEVLHESLGSSEYFRDVKIDPVNQVVYWGSSPNDSPGVIYYNDLNETAPFSAPTSFSITGEPRGLDLDLINDKLYWVCRGANNGTVPAMIMRSNLDGTSKEIVFTVFMYPSGYPSSSTPGSAFMALDLRGMPAPPPPLKLINVTPAPNAFNIPLNSDIVLTFDQDVDTTTAIADNVIITGEQTGIVPGTFSSSLSDTIIFNPANDFKPGEIIRITLTTGLQSIYGMPLSQSYSYKFLTVNTTGPETPDFFQENAATVISDSVDAQSVQAIDIDSDGDIDVGAAGFANNEIMWFENDSSQNFTEHIISTNATQPTDIFFADIDADGDIDLVSSSQGDEKVAWYENDGSENFTERIISTTATDAQAVFAIDLEGDGDMDILSANAGTGEVIWYDNDGSESFTAKGIASGLNTPHDVYVADMDRDGDLDALTTALSNDEIYWLENDGNQNFTVHVVSNVPDGPWGVFAMDLDGDTDVDVISSAEVGDEIAWYENDGNQFFTRHVITTNADGVRAFRIADIDADGDLDLVTASANDNKIAWFENDSTLSFTEHIVTTDAGAARGVYIADMDLDGDLDILAGTQTDDQVLWYENTTSGCTDPPTASAGADQSICEGSTVSLSGSIGGSATSSSWATGGDGTFDDNTSLSAVYTPGSNDISSGMTQLILSTDDPDGTGPCTTASDTLVVTIDSMATVNAGTDMTACPSGISLSGSMGGSASNPAWTTSGSGTFADSSMISTSYTASTADIAAGSVNLTLTVDAAGACPQVSDQITATLYQPVVAEDVSVDATVGQAVNVDVVTPATTNTGDTINVAILQDGLKGTTVLQSDNTLDYTSNTGTVGADTVQFRICNQCDQCDTGLVLINILNEPPVITPPSNSPPVSAGSIVTISLTSLLSDLNNNLDLGTLTIVGQPASGAIASIDTNSNLVIDYSNVLFTGTDIVTIEVCDSLGACTIQELQIEVARMAINVFNAVSPNGDGKHDFLEIENIQFYPGSTVLILNRWGEILERIENYDNVNNIFTGTGLPDGTYYYQISLDTGGGSPQIIQGFFVLKVSD